MSDETALLAAIIAHPAEDTPRLMYADWLDEHAGQVPCSDCENGVIAYHLEPDRRGEPLAYCLRCNRTGRVPDGRAARAEFIRVQCELARPFAAPCRACGKSLEGDRVADGCPCNSPRGINHGVVPDYVCTCAECDPEQTGSVRARPAGLAEMCRRELDLWDSHAREWFPLVDKFKMGTTHRGFVNSLICTAADWIAHADQITAAHPVTRVRLTTWPKSESVIYGGGVRGWRFEGRGHVHAAADSLTMLKAEWPNITFETPT